MITLNDRFGLFSAPAARRLALRQLAVLVLLPGLPVYAQGPSALQLTAPEALAQSQAGKLTLIDIRTPGEWQDTGVPKGALRINLQHPGGAAGFASEVLKSVKGNPAAAIALICRTGNRSSVAQKVLQAHGLSRVYNVPEGMAGSSAGPGWLQRGLPLQQP